MEKNKTIVADTASNYSGSITMTVLRKNKVISKKVYKNHGSKKLFYFISSCLCGNFSSTYMDNIPAKIKLFTYTEYDTNKPSVLKKAADTITQVTTLSELHTGFISRNAPGSPDSGGEETAGRVAANSEDWGTCTLHFLIPGMYLNGENPLHVLCLYGANASDKDDYYAYYTMNTFNSNGEINDEWDNSVKGLSKDTTIKIDWTLTIGNKSVTNN